MTEFSRLIIGALLTIPGALLPWTLMHSEGLSNKKPPKGVSDKTWEVWFPDGIGKAGEVLGYLERLLFFVAAWTGKHEIIVGWLAFKVASKWEVWTNVKKPAEIREGNLELYDFRSRNIIGTVLLGRFLIGTLSNVLIGFIAAYIAKHC